MNPTRKELENNRVAVLNKGRFANATVSLSQVGDEKWVMKDFSTKHWIVRNFSGRFLLWREMRILSFLQGLKGMPQQVFRVDDHAIAFRYIPARVLAERIRGEYTPDYFPNLEKLVNDMHARGVIHFDLRYMHNVLVCDDGTPGLIDFQTAIYLPPWMNWLSHYLWKIDISGVYKHWLKRSPETIDEAKLIELQKHKAVRKYWILSGYLGRRSRHRKRKLKQMKKELN